MSEEIRGQGARLAKERKAKEVAEREARMKALYCDDLELVLRRIDDVLENLSLDLYETTQQITEIVKVNLRDVPE